MPDKQRTVIDSGGLRLQGRLRETAAGGPSPAAVICHPHPRFGGSMDNNLVHALEQFLSSRGIVTLAFNFRGVGGSDGQYDNMAGEVGDVIAALQHVASLPGVDASRIGLAGYSFGGLMAMQACSSLLASAREGKARGKTGDYLVPACLALVSPMYPGKPWDKIAELRTMLDHSPPALVIAGTSDRFCPLNAAKDLAVTIGMDCRLVVVEGGDHFYWEREAEAAEPAADLFSRVLMK